MEDEVNQVSRPPTAQELMCHAPAASAPEVNACVPPPAPAPAPHVVPANANGTRFDGSRPFVGMYDADARDAQRVYDTQVIPGHCTEPDLLAHRHLSPGERASIDHAVAVWSRTGQMPMMPATPMPVQRPYDGPSISEDHGGGVPLSDEQRRMLAAGMTPEDPQITALRAMERGGPVMTLMATPAMIAGGNLNTQNILRAAEMAGPIDDALGTLAPTPDGRPETAGPNFQPQAAEPMPELRPEQHGAPTHVQEWRGGRVRTPEQIARDNGVIPAPRPGDHDFHPMNRAERRAVDRAQRRR